MSFSSKSICVLRIVSWSLYDLANQFFSLNIVSLYFIRWLTLERGCPEFYYSLAFGSSTLVVALASPLLGAAADATGRNRMFLSVLTLVAVAFTMALGFTGNVMTALVFFGIANFGCQTATVFYNTLLKYVAPQRSVGLISGVGRMFAYSGAIIAMFVAKPIVVERGYQAIFFPTGLLFLMFALPCMFFVKDPGCPVPGGLRAFFRGEALREYLRKLFVTLFDGGKPRVLACFLKASFWCLCGVNAIIVFMAVYVSRVFGLGEGDLVNLMSFSTLFAIAGSVISGILGDRFGCLRVLRVVFVLWMGSFAFGSLARDARMYWLIGAFVGITLGSTWSLLRAMLLRLSPEGKVGEVFGLFNLLTYLSSVLGAVSWGLITLLLGRFGSYGYRVALFSLNIFIVIGFVYLLKVPREES